jgi:hypothetical protein
VIVRARTFWIALPVALVLALWLGPGLARDEAYVAPPPSTEGALTPHVDPADGLKASEMQAIDEPPPEPAPEPECESPADYGPDGDG